MRRLTTSVVAVVMAATLSPALYAQWPAYPPSGVPKGSDGKVDLTAPAPRTADGKPDLSGHWGGAPRREKPGEAEASGRPPLASGMGNLGVNMVGGLPYTPWAKQMTDMRVANLRADNPDGTCLPQGPIEYHLDPQPRNFYQMPGRFVMVYESNYGLRTIFTDGRPLPKLGDPQPYFHGYSVGRWEGDTLVVESNNFVGADSGQKYGWFDQLGSPYTGELRLTERFRRPNFGTLEIDITIEDPKAYTRPFTVKIEHGIVADGTEPGEFICHDNQDKFLEFK